MSCRCRSGATPGSQQSAATAEWPAGLSQQSVATPMSQRIGCDKTSHPDAVTADFGWKSFWMYRGGTQVPSRLQNDPIERWSQVALEAAAGRLRGAWRAASKSTSRRKREAASRSFSIQWAQAVPPSRLENVCVHPWFSSVCFRLAELRPGSGVENHKTSLRPAATLIRAVIPYQTDAMKRKSDHSLVPVCKKGRPDDSPTNYHCTSGSEDLDIQVRNARIQFNLGSFQVALEIYQLIYQSICQNSPHESPQKHIFFLHIVLDVSRCHLALLQVPEAFEALSPCYCWGQQTSISWSHPLWSEVSTLIASSRTLIDHKERIQIMLENEQWKEATGCISDVAQDRSVNFRNSTTQLTGFWSVSNAEALMWLGEKILARKETKLVDRYKTIINTYNSH
ncbi:hypothetical protein PSTT_15555 [Puccinia striiformis]|uniref:Uncharacterized protein n=1 Tax=Puccinia striiformis TaxID=27350 RepID=A0A2S4UHB0_9BASI|nr:hypothetical protein PSTT_15555 [Puccinia striiformis]